MSLFRWLVLATLAGAVSDESSRTPPTDYLAVAPVTAPVTAVGDEVVLEDEPRVEIGEAIVRIYDAHGRVVAVQ